MSDNMTVAQRSRTMSRIRSSGNMTTEVRFATLLRAARLSGWRRKVALPGRPDFVFSAARVAVFVDGCFWHGCPRCSLGAKSNQKYWRTKIAGNIARDRRITAQLRVSGWKVVRVWEHAVRIRPQRCVARVRRAVGKSEVV